VRFKPFVGCVSKTRKLISTGHIQISLKTKAMFCQFYEHAPAFELFPSRNLLEHRVRVWSLDRALDRWVDQAYPSPITRENTRRLDPEMFPTVEMTALGLYTLIRSFLTCHHSTTPLSVAVLSYYTRHLFTPWTTVLFLRGFGVTCISCTTVVLAHIPVLYGQSARTPYVR